MIEQTALPGVLDAIFARHNPDVVMHLAAERHVDRSIDGPGDFVAANITGTYNMLEAARAQWKRNGRPADFRFQQLFGVLRDAISAVPTSGS